MKKTRIIGFILLAVLLLVSCGKSTEQKWQEQYDLGVKYVSEGNYEEAIIAFTAAIEIDPDRAEAYLGRGQAYCGLGTGESLELALADYEYAIDLDGTLTEAYLGMAEIYLIQGDIDGALNILETGYEKTGSNEILLKIEELTAMLEEDAGQEETEALEEEAEQEEEPGNEVARLFKKGDAGDLLRFEEVLLFGNSVEGLTMDTLGTILSENGFYLSFAFDAENIYYWDLADDAYRALYAMITKAAYSEKMASIKISDEGEAFPVGIRELSTLDTLGTVLADIGFSTGEEIAAYIVDCLQSAGEGLPAEMSEWKYENDQASVFFTDTNLLESKEGSLSVDITLVIRWNNGYQLELDFGSPEGDLSEEVLNSVIIDAP